jgi:hypothetical protein
MRQDNRGALERLYCPKTAFVADRTEHPQSRGALQRNSRSAVPRIAILPVRPAC